MRDGRYDFAALNQCASKLKASNRDFADENQVYITANPGTPYQTLVSVIDALRNDALNPGQILFDNVNFKVSL